MTSPARRILRVALAGNPNSGKTSLFNLLTGLHQQVGNWPGVTIERKWGRTEHAGYVLEIVDLPGIYSLSAHSLEERIARDALITEPPDIVVNVLDAAGLARHLHLTVQLLEMELDVVLALNMWDEAERSGAALDRARLETLLGVASVPTIGHRGQGRTELLDAIVRLAEERHPGHRHVPVALGEALEQAVQEIAQQIEAGPDAPHGLPARYLAVKLIEGDANIASELYNRAAHLRPLLATIEERRARLRRAGGGEPARLIDAARHGFVTGLLREVQPGPARDRMALSRRIDTVLTHRWLGLPIFLACMVLLFTLTFTLGEPPKAALTWLVGAVARAAAALLPDGFLEALVIDGILSGVGAVLVFLPNILLLFLGVALLETTGYMARAAFVMDRVMHVLGLHGKSFIPMLMGFGCTVPAILATRTLESRRDRILTSLLVPHMSCSARLPVYVLLAGAFFERHAGQVVALIYLLGIVVAIAVGRLFSATLFRGEHGGFVMELPPYRWPSARGLIVQTWERGRHYLRKMGGVILLASLLLWTLSVLPPLPAHPAPAACGDSIAVATSPAPDAMPPASQSRLTLEHSIIGRVGRAMAPVIAPLGFPWPLGVTLITGFVAKEVVVSSLAVLYQTGGAAGSGGRAALSAALREPAAGLEPLAAVAFMVFVLLYTPCVAAVLTIRRELGTRWMLFDIGYQLALAWVAAFAVYQGGRLLGLG